MKNKVNVAIVGATGMVGATLLSILEERKFPIKNLFLLASHRSKGDTRDFRGKSEKIQDVADFDFSQTEISFFCASNDIAAEYAPKAAEKGNIVIDKSSYFRYDPDIPLIIPEVNFASLKKYKKNNIIASPNCSTIPIVIALKSLHEKVGLTRLNIATYQSVSGTGKEAVKELAEQTAQLLNGKPITTKVYPQQIAFNLLPHIDDFQDNGYTKEEMKLVWEIQKILQDPNLSINPTAVRVPVFYGHSAAVHLETKEPLEVEEMIALLKNQQGIHLSLGKMPYATPAKDAAGKDDVFVGRIRKDLRNPLGINMWIVSDNVRKGAALNAVQIAEALLLSNQDK